MKKAVAFVALSDPIDEKRKEKIDALERLFQAHAIEVSQSAYLYTPFDRDLAEKKAKEVEAYFYNQAITDVFDLSGGNLANLVLAHLDLAKVAASETGFWAYSDLSVLLNAFYSQGRKNLYLFQARNILEEKYLEEMFFAYLLEGDRRLFQLEDLQRDNDEAFVSTAVIGGNIRCSLKLLGTRFWPKLEAKTLLLESNGGSEFLIRSQMAQLAMLEDFHTLDAVLIGRFLAAEEEGVDPYQIAKEQFPESLRILQTKEIGHHTASKAVRIGEAF